MAAIFNNNYITKAFSCAINDRALQFGDGLFETIRIENGKAQLLNYHMERLLEGAGALRFNIPKYITEESLQSQIAELLFHNHFGKNATAKLIVWRRNDYQKAYTSTDTGVNTLLMLRPASTPVTKQRAGFSEDVILHYWKLSRFKTISALPYIMASQERDSRKLDELILLNVHGHITESTSSNIFWSKDDIYYTPALTTGCIAGVQRRHILKTLGTQKIEFHEVEEGKEALLNADGVFVCNSSGLSPIAQLNNITYCKSEYIIKKLT
ncbi:aminotransferase class IV [Fulvivirga ulvae]|uniref:aminotransferase class IV n=1 Tax=Fulvivirga ulvae TaxID=2904245 RepID=UPI001F2AD3C2|nr:aminotransferase class IV [Fulvivirga ulvae]UII30898.1 aminotransferase class IV [Fulvivirga ulvae]